MEPVRLHTWRQRLTRRGLLQAGGAGALAAVALDAPAARAAGQITRAGAPPHLRRSSYERLADRTFRGRAGNAEVELALLEIGDLARAREEPELAGADDAFCLLLGGPVSPVLQQGIHELANRELGSFAIFLVPVSRPADRQLYEVVVDRTVRRSGTR